MSNINTGANVRGSAKAGRDFISRDQITNNIVQQVAHYSPSALHQLRPIPATFTGRAAEIEQLLAQLNAARVQQRGQPITNISSVKGMGGIGKTELANLAAHALVPDYPDVQLFVELGAHSPAPRSSTQALAFCIRAFGGNYAEAKLPDDEASLRAIYLSLLSGKRALVLLDDALDDAQVQALLPPPGCACLITTRNALNTGEPLALDTLDRAESVALLRRLYARLSEAEAHEIAQLCDDMPIALTVAGGYLKAHIGAEVREYLAALRGPYRLENLAVQDVFAASYRLLPSDRQAALRALSVMAADFDRKAALAVIRRPLPLRAEEVGGEGVDNCANCLDDLVACSLFQYNATNERYDWHDLLRAYVRAQTPDDEYASAARRHAVHYMSVLDHADDLYLQGGDHVLAGLRLFDQEWPHIQAGQQWTVAQAHAGSGDDARLGMAYANAGVHVLSLRLHPCEHIRWLDAQLAAARTLRERKHEGFALSNLGNTYANMGDIRQAIDYYEQALMIARELGDRRGEGNALGGLGLAYSALGDIRQAIDYYEQCLIIHCELGDRRSEGASLGNLGNAYAAVGDARKAIDYYEQALVIARAIGNCHDEGTALGSLGSAYRQLGDAKQSIDYYEQCLTIYHELGDRHREGVVLSNIGVVYDNLGDLPKAIESYEKALAILHDIGDRYTEAITSWNLGLIHEQQGDLPRAIALTQVRVDFEREIGHADAEKRAAVVDALRLRARLGGSDGNRMARLKSTLSRLIRR